MKRHRRRLVRLRDAPQELEDELAFHFTSVVEELMAAGRTRDEAEAEARRRFGDEMRYRRELEAIDREVGASRRRRERAGSIRASVGSAFRGIRRSPGLSAGVILAFGLGIGANATMFGIIDRLLLSPPSHIADAGAVHRVLVGRTFLGRALRVNTIAPVDYEGVKDLPQFAGVAGYSGVYRHMLGRGVTARSVRDVSVTGNYWSVLGVKPAIGRFFTPGEDHPGGDRVAVIGWDLYESLFDGEPSALGSTLDFGLGEYTVIGVAPKGFTGVDLTRIDLFLPLQVGVRDVMGEFWLQCGSRCSWIRLVGRLAPGSTVAAAEAAATPVHRRGRGAEIAEGQYDANARIILASLIAARDPDGPKEARVAAWLSGVSAIVLLIACVNVVNLLLARSIRQRREQSIRLALGISKGRLIADALAEGILLALAGGVAAVAIARWGGEVVRSALLPNVTWSNHGIGGATLALTATLSVVTGAIAAVLPSLRSIRQDVALALRATSGGVTRSTGGVRAALSITQAALCVVLLVGAGLFVRSLSRVRSLDLGFDMDGLLIASPIDDGSGMDDDAMKRFFTDAPDRLSRLAGVRSAAASLGVPFYTSWGVDIRVPGVDSIPQQPSGGPYVTAVSPDYMQTLGLRVIRGRNFDGGDTGAPQVAIVNESMAKLVWPGRDPLGDCMRLEEQEVCTTVIGIVEDARRGSIMEEPNPQFYIPLSHPVVPDPAEMAFVRVDRVNEPTIRAVRDALLALEPRLRFVNVRPLSELSAPEMRSWRLGATMFTVFGILALIVASIGLYSVLAFDVAQRTREIGLRSALGAGATRLLGEVLGRSLRLTLVGLLIGATLSLALAPRIGDLLYDTTPRDPGIFGLVAAILIVVAVAAGAVPAWRAIRVDPNIALRMD